MIDLRHLDEFRDAEWEKRIARGQPIPRDKVGCFRLPSPIDGQDLRCLVSAGETSDRRLGLPPWDHVSVSRADRIPWWAEMDYIARKFFRPKETCMQLHVPDSEHVNHNENCLHLWRPAGLKKIPLPPSIMVGPDAAKGRHPMGVVETLR
jgi:hypothetical protein